MNAAQFFDHWNKVWSDLMRAVSLLGDDHLKFRPTEHYSRTVGDILRHIINLEQGWIHYVIRRELSEWPEENEPDDVEALRQALGHPVARLRAANPPPRGAFSLLESTRAGTT